MSIADIVHHFCTVWHLSKSCMCSEEAAFSLLAAKKILMKKGSFCLVGPNVEQAVYSCNDEDIVVNLIMRFSSFAESFLGLMWEQGIMSEFLWRMLYSRTDNGCLMYDVKKKKL